MQQLVQGVGNASELHFSVGAFSRLVHEVAQDFKSDLKWRPYTIECVQIAIEAHLRELLSTANNIATWAERQDGNLVKPRDIQLARRLRKEIHYRIGSAQTGAF